MDLCVLQRPLDKPDQVRIVLEGDAVLGVLSLCETGQVELMSSEALLYETERNPSSVRRAHAESVLALAKTTLYIDQQVETRASKFAQHGIKALDALHLALAEAGHADYFCTCDDRLSRKAQRIEDLGVKVLSPVELVQEIER